MFTKIIGALGVAMALNSCATVIRGVHEDLKVVSNPSGADVTLSTGERGITPATFVKRRRNSFQVTVSKPGYYSQTVTVRSKASTTGAAATAGNVATVGARCRRRCWNWRMEFALSESGLGSVSSATRRTPCQAKEIRAGWLPCRNAD